ncbi:MAG: helix-turn-helix transcriptional regulator [Muribaculaceae bacterium]|nr:helix-turn-helix transcriptional regulator [Muribaculaceae bacterium]
MMGLLLVLVWLGAAADGTVRLKNYDIWKDLPTKTLMEMGGRFYNECKADSALMCYNIVTNRYYTDSSKDNNQLEMYVRAMNQLGILYTIFYPDYEKAHKYLLQAEKIAKDNHYLSVLSAVYGNLSNLYHIGCIYSNNGNLDDRTISTNHLAFETAIESNDPAKIITAAFNVAYVSDDSVGIQVFRKDLKWFLNYTIPDSLKHQEYVKYFCRGALEESEEHYETALQWYEKALAYVYHENARVMDISRNVILTHKGNVHIKLHQDQKALDIVYGFIKQAKANNDSHGLYGAYLSLSEFYHNVKKDSILGDRYELLALREKDIVQNKNKLLDSEKTEFLFQIDEINAEVQALATKQRMTKMIAWGITAVTIIIVGLLYLLWRKYKQEQEKNRKLYENNIALLAAEEERRQQIIEQQQTTKYQSHQVEEGEQSDLLHRILYVMETNEEIYDNDFSLERLTELVDATSKNYVSQALNGHYHQSFPNIVNEYRIREACRRINDPEHYGQYTVQAIAQSVGFGSYPNFVTNFKKFTGLTPNAYRKQRATQPPADSALSHADGADVI